MSDSKLLLEGVLADAQALTPGAGAALRSIRRLEPTELCTLLSERLAAADRDNLRGALDRCGKPWAKVVRPLLAASGQAVSDPAPLLAVEVSGEAATRDALMRIVVASEPVDAERPADGVSTRQSVVVVAPGCTQQQWLEYLEAIDDGPEVLAAWRSAVVATRSALAVDWVGRRLSAQRQILGARRAILEKEAQTKRKPAGFAGGGPGAGLANRAKPLLQALLKDFERGAAESVAALVGVPAGRLLRDLDRVTTNSLRTLDQVVRSNAIVTSVPRAFEAEVNRYLHDQLLEHFASDLRAFNDLSRIAVQRIEKLLADEGLPPVRLDPMMAKDDLVNTLLARIAVLRFVYRGELPNRHFAEYFSQIRKYAMLLVMSGSMLGMSAVMRKYSEVTVPLTIMVIAMGAYNVYSATAEERWEAEIKDLDGARETVRQECRRTLAEIQRQWTAVIATLVADQQAYLLQQVEDAVAQDATRRNQLEEGQREEVETLLAGTKEAAARVDALVTRLKAIVPTAAAGGAGAVGVGGTAKPTVAADVRPGRTAEPAAAGPSLQDARAKLEALKASMKKKTDG